MDRGELLTAMHRYTPWEELHMHNLNARDHIDEINQALDIPLNEYEKAYGLHLPHIPDHPESTFSEKLFFSDVPGQDIVIVQHDRYTPPELHRHDFYELLYVYEGEFTQQIEEERFLMHTGDFCLIPPHVCHSLDVSNYSIVLNILITRRKFREIILGELREENILASLFPDYADKKDPFPSDGYVIFHTDGDTEIRDMILSMCLEEINKAKYSRSMLNAQLLLLFGTLLRDHERTCELPALKRKKAGNVPAILQYIESNYSTLSLQDLAEHFHYSTQYMSHLLKQATGMTFTEYLTQKRMEAASALLTGTNMKIRDISDQVGYQNQEHFIRTFRKYYGTSPGRFRSTHKRADSAG